MKRTMYDRKKAEARKRKSREMCALLLEIFGEPQTKDSPPRVSDWVAYIAKWQHTHYHSRRSPKTLQMRYITSTHGFVPKSRYERRKFSGLPTRVSRREKKLNG